MTRRILLQIWILGCLLVASGSMYGQRIQSIDVKDNKLVGNLHRVLTCNEAGTINVSTSRPGQSLDNIFLCFGDSLVVDHLGDQDLSGDPNPATPPGIQYFIYDDVPTITGCTVEEILMDPALNQTSPIIIDGMPVDINPITPIWSYSGEPDGDMTLRNDGSTQEAFNGGDPFSLWLAPATVDDFEDVDNDGNFEDGGQCVDINTDEAFRVTFLNEIEFEVLDYPYLGNFNEVRVRITGGLPEWDGTMYSTDIRNTTDPSLLGLPTSRESIADGEEMVISVPESGTYSMSFFDNIGCDVTVIFDFLLPTDFTMNIECIEGQPGDTLCSALTVSNFNEISSMQFTIGYDPRVVRITGVQDFGIPNLGEANFNISNDQGFMTLVWFDPGANGITVDDGTVLVNICFELIGDPNDMSPISIVDVPTAIEIGNSSGQAIENLNILNCDAQITCGDLFLGSSSCSTPSGQSSGNLLLDICCGQSPFTLDWEYVQDPTVNGTEVIADDCSEYLIDNLEAGDYNVTITDNNGVVINQVLTIENGESINAVTGFSPPACVGLSNGMLYASDISGGTAPYDLVWLEDDSLIAFGVDTLQVPAGSYELIVTDSNGCQARFTQDVEENGIEVSLLSSNDARCSGVSDGSLVIEASGGTPFNGDEYEYEWDDGVETQSALGFRNSLEAGVYIVTVSDQNSCQVIDTFQIGNQKTLTFDLEQDSISCDGDMDGRFLVTGVTRNGPAAVPYTFTWSANAPASVDTDTSTEISNLGVDLYRLTIMDQEGCSVDTQFVPYEPNPLRLIQNNIQAESCEPGGDGRIIVFATGGNPDPNTQPPFDYDWGPNLPDEDNVATGLVGDSTYSVTVTDINGCTDSIDVYLPVEATVDITDAEITSVDCFGDSDGRIALSIDPDQLSTIISVTWEHGDSGLVIDNLTAGDYTVEILNTDSCITRQTFTVELNSMLMIADTLIQEPSCAGDNDGSISLIVQGNTGQISYEWDHPNGTNNPVLPGIGAGVYSVTISDEGDCGGIQAEIIVGEPDSIRINPTTIVPTTCFEGTCDGAVAINVTGGPDPSAGYGITWEDGSTADSLSNLCGGYVSLTVTNTALCGIIDSIFIPSPDPISFENITAQEPSCFGDSDGSISVTVQGGNMNYTIVWDHDASTGMQINNLASGTYSAMITDQEGCTGMDSVFLSQPDSLIAVIDSLNSNSLGCAGEDDGAITVDISGGTPDYTIDWSPNVSTTDMAMNLGVGTYEISVTDVNGCNDTTSYRVNAPIPIEANIPSPRTPDCFGDRTEIYVSSASGGIGAPYTFTINNGVRRPLTDSVEVIAGQYLVSVFDQSGCSFDTTIIIEQPSQIQVNVPDTLFVDLGLELNIDADITHELPIDSVSWSIDQMFDCLNSDCSEIEYIPLESGSIFLRVTDANGCVLEKGILVLVDDSRNVYIPNVFSPNRDGLNDFFNVYTEQNVEQVTSFQVFNRWGDLVYAAQNIDPEFLGNAGGWDGLHKGQLAETGVYVYAISIRFIDGKEIVYRGDVTLVR